MTPPISVYHTWIKQPHIRHCDPPVDGVAVYPRHCEECTHDDEAIYMDRHAIRQLVDARDDITITRTPKGTVNAKTKLIPELTGLIQRQIDFTGPIPSLSIQQIK